MEFYATGFNRNATMNVFDFISKGNVATDLQPPEYTIIWQETTEGGGIRIYYLEWTTVRVNFWPDSQEKCLCNSTKD